MIALAAIFGAAGVLTERPWLVKVALVFYAAALLVHGRW